MNSSTQRSPSITFDDIQYEDDFSEIWHGLKVSIETVCVSHCAFLESGYVNKKRTDNKGNKNNIKCNFYGLL